MMNISRTIKIPNDIGIRNEVARPKVKFPFILSSEGSDRVD